MSYISPVGAATTQTNYNAVKIKINEPETNVSDKFCGVCQDNAAYNAINIEVDRPRVNMGTTACEKPETKEPVAYDKSYYLYQSNPMKQPKEAEATSQEVIDNSGIVPEPNFTTTENEKLNSKLNFHGKDIEIVPGEEIKPDIDINQIVTDLKSDDLDKQAAQMENIAKAVLSKKGNAEDYVVNDIFTSLIDIAQKDTTNLEAPSKEQVEARKKIIANIITAEKNAQDPKTKNNKLPFELSKEEVENAIKLSPLEQAERNKEYAISTLALLSKTYIDGYEKRTGKVVPITDVPGVANIVDTMKSSQNPDVKATAIDALMYIYRKEYAEEIKEIISIVANEENPVVAKRAQSALNAIKE